jgi:hypothetical protein
MVKGHLDQTQKNQATTKQKAESENTNNDGDDDVFPTSTSSGEQSHHCYATIMEPMGQIYADQTGRFVQASSNGNNYLLILYDYDINSILAEPLKTQTGQAILAAYKILHTKLCNAGFHPKFQYLNNECSEALKQFMSNDGVDYQIVPPGIHHRNAPERAICTFKNHFIAGLCSIDKHFPLHLWDQHLVPQAVITLNMMRGSRINLQLSAWVQINDNFDFNRTPLAPPGIRVLVHEKPQNGETWSPHALDEWYIGPALEPYRCYNVWLWDTRHERICETIPWFPTKVTMPLASSADLVMAGIQDIIQALQNPTANSPLAPRTDS